jgi:DNA-binding NarL/FixJ family response regulator
VTLPRTGRTGNAIHILVVDDYEPWRRFVCLTLQIKPQCEVISEAADGLEAVQKTQQLRPDLVLLDIGLPTLNGIKVARRMREVSPKTIILFLSEIRSLDIVEEALRTGASGYVVKSSAASDLLPAIAAVLQGKRFVSPSLEGNDFLDSTTAEVSPPRASQTETKRCHEVGFYAQDRALVDGFARFVKDALKNGNAVIVIATESHRASLLQRLSVDGAEVDRAVKQNRYVALDAAQTLSTITSHDMLDPTRFLELAGKLISTAAQSATGGSPRVAICGECDPPLWTIGSGELQIEVEQLWNVIAGRYDVKILCGYSMGSALGKISRELLQRICAEHSAIHPQ